MKKASRKTRDDDLRPEYDLAKLGPGVRGKYYRQATYYEWLRRKVGDSMAGAGRGETVPDEDVRAWLQQRERA